MGTIRQRRIAHSCQVPLENSVCVYREHGAKLNSLSQEIYNLSTIYEFSFFFKYSNPSFLCLFLSLILSLFTATYVNCFI